MPNGTILLIDDEALLRQAVARTLELEGYTVLQAPDAHRGLAMLRDHAADVLVILSDGSCPTGVASTCCRATKRWPRWPRWC